MLDNISYSKKVFDYFQKPKNFGKIANPDGVGQVGNLVCLPPNQYIHIKNGLMPIEEIDKNDMVFSHTGYYNAVIQKKTRTYNGEIVTLKNKLGSVLLTPEHLLLAIKIPEKNKFLRTKNKKTLIPAWYHASQLKKYDTILYPISKTKKDIYSIHMNIPKSKYDFKSRDIPKNILLTDSFLRIAGYFLAEGHATNHPTRTFIAFALNIKEKDIVEDLKRASKNVFGLDIKTRKIPKKRTIIVYIFNARLARLFRNLFGANAENKTIPDFIMNLPPEKQKPLIYGLWKGDGYINLDRDGPRAGFTTISHKLAQQMKILLLRQKIVPSIYAEEPRKIDGVYHRKAYRIHVGQRDSLKKICSILNDRYVPKSYQSEKAWLDNNYLYIPITSIKKKKYKGVVYNLEVENSHSFVSEAFCLHNCGDVMKLYIKVSKNKKGQEIIKDVKFETLGCVAAIATSSAITEMVKGKTIAEALKIDKNKIVKMLGGLPMTKLHCSVLAVDALAKAVYDYYERTKKSPSLK